MSKPNTCLASVRKIPKRKLFETLVQAYAKDLYRYGYWLSGDSGIAEDLVQETMMRAWRSIDSLKDPKAAKSWLFTILRRENYRRFKKKSVQLEVASIDDAQVQPHLVSDDGLSHMDNLAMRQALHKMPKVYSEPLVLQVLGGYSCDEIAQIIDIKPGAVMTRICRAKKRLRNILKHDHTSGSSHA